jgi:hypothetical protein
VRSNCFLLCTALTLVACSDTQQNEAGRLCDPGATDTCTCDDGRDGASVCSDNGAEWSACTCTGDEPGDAGGGDDLGNDSSPDLPDIDPDLPQDVEQPAPQGYAIVDTAQDLCFDTAAQVDCPAAGQLFHGQDAQHEGHAPSYRDNADGTVTDLVTGLMWQQTPADDKATFADAVADADGYELAGHSDWRIPSLKELYSLTDFRGRVGRTEADSIPYLQTEYFDFQYGQDDERLIDAQFVSSTQYLGTTINSDATVFGVNFADGRIKGYPRDRGPGGSPFTFYVRHVRGNPDYGVNDLEALGDGTIRDNATDLLWAQADQGEALNWSDAMASCQELELAGREDWRLPNAKELHSIIDYTRAPDATDPSAQGPAIDPIFSLTDDDSYFWTSTTHLDGPNAWGVYFAVGTGWGWFELPPGSGDVQLINVHGAGCQRSDPKDGDPADWPQGNGPQGDVVRIFNHARCVADVE